jgi:hypothetical protein
MEIKVNMHNFEALLSDEYPITLQILEIREHRIARNEILKKCTVFSFPKK